jgi:hypothetical protein
MTPKQLFEISQQEDENIYNLGNGLVLKIDKNDSNIVTLSRHGTFIKKADLSDKVEKRLFIIEAVGLGAIQYRIAKALDISRQTIHNYREIKDHFGSEGLVQGYTLNKSKSRRIQRKENAEGRIGGNKAQQVAQIRKKAKQEREKKQRSLDFSFGYEGEAKKVEKDEHPFCEKHDWEPSRFSGVFAYLIVLITEWKWLQLVMGYFGSSYKIFMIFVLMAACNLRSIEQLKNIRSREAGVILGIKRIAFKQKVWQWFYTVAEMKQARPLLFDYFRYQVSAGLVGMWIWFIDGHYLPYTGKQKVHFSFNTKRQRPEPGRTNMVTCDGSGRVVDFEIQEGKGDLRGHICSLGQKWKDYIPGRVVKVFDREGQGAEFFYNLISQQEMFVTWEKNIDSKKLAALDEDLFAETFEFNGKTYSIFEGSKEFRYTSEGNENNGSKEHTFSLRRIYIWNKSSNRRTCGLAFSAEKEMSSKECALAILSRWGASENAFKHIQQRHPFHYHPGFKLTESKNQEIKNPAIKDKDKEISRVKSELNRLYKKMSKAFKGFKKDGTPRKNSAKEQLKKKVVDKEAKLAQLVEEKNKLPERVDVSQLEDYRSFKEIDNEGKYLFDFVTSSVWNARKQMVDWLRPFFNQENELVDLLYAITYCHGWIKSTGKEVIVRLEPLEQKSRRLAQEQLCRKLTSLGAQTPNGKWLVIEVGESPI